MALIPLTPEQEVEAQQLAQRIHEATREDILALARLIVSKRAADLFGETEFQARDIVHRVATRALEVHLAEKKTATTGAASSAPTASKPPSSRATGRKAP